MFKWKSFSNSTKSLQIGSKPFFSSRKSSGVLGQKRERFNSFALFSEKVIKRTTLKKNLQDSFYASGGFLEKKPEFWSFTSTKQKKILFSKNLKTLQQNQRETKNIKPSSFFQKRVSVNSKTLKNLALYRNSFLIFLKCLENHKKFVSLLTLNVKKSLFKRSLYKQKSSFWKILAFRAIKPIHIEVSYNLLNIIYLYSPQRINFPFFMDLDLINRSLR